MTPERFEFNIGTRKENKTHSEWFPAQSPIEPPGELLKTNAAQAPPQANSIKIPGGGACAALALSKLLRGF